MLDTLLTNVLFHVFELFVNTSVNIDDKVPVCSDIVDLSCVCFIAGRAL